MRSSIVATSIALVWALAPAPASACTTVCSTTLSPSGTAMVPARLPVNGVFVALGDSCHRADAAFEGPLTVHRLRQGMLDTFTLDPGGSTDPVEIPGVEIDDRLTITFVAERGATVVSVIHVMPEAPLPTTVGVLEVGASRVGDVDVLDLGGACATPLSAAVASYTVALDAGLDPWRDALVLTPIVDGSVWDEASHGFAPPSTIFAHCVAPTAGQSPHDTTPGEHVLRVEGTIRGMATVPSNDVPFELTCTGGGPSCSIALHTPSRGGWPLVLAAALAGVLARRSGRVRASARR